MKRNVLFIALIFLGLANLAFGVSYLSFVDILLNDFPVAGILTIVATLTALAADIFAVIGIVKSAKDKSYNPSRMVASSIGLFFASYLAGKYVSNVLIKNTVPGPITIILWSIIPLVIIFTILVGRKPRKYRGNPKCEELSNSRLSFIYSIITIIITVFSGGFAIVARGEFFFNRFLTIAGNFLLLIASILVLVGFGGYIKERRLFPNKRDDEYLKPQQKPQVSKEDPKEIEVKNAMEQYGMTREEAEAATGYNKPTENPANQFVGMGLGLNVQQAQQGLAQSQPATAPVEQPKPQVDNSAEIAELKRQLLQGKITRAEFDEKLAELKNQ